MAKTLGGSAFLSLSNLNLQSAQSSTIWLCRLVKPALTAHWRKRLQFRHI
jgi:hypothetical protein